MFAVIQQLHLTSVRSILTSCFCKVHLAIFTESNDSGQLQTIKGCINTELKLLKMSPKSLNLSIFLKWFPKLSLNT